MSARRNLRKLWLIIPGVLIVGLAGAYIVRNSIVRSAIQDQSQKALGVSTSLSTVNLDLVGQSFSLNGFGVDNPDDFDGDRFLRLGHGQLSVDGGSVFSETIRVPRLELSDIRMHLVQDGSDGNYKQILQNIKRHAGEAGAAAQEADTKPAKKLFVDQIVIKNVEVSVDLKMPGMEPKQGSVKIDEIKLHDVGGQQGVDIGQLVGVVTQALMQSTLEASGNDLPGLLAQGVRQQLSGLPTVDLEASGMTASLDQLDTDGLIDQAKSKVLDLLPGSGGK